MFRPDVLYDLTPEQWVLLWWIRETEQDLPSADLEEALNALVAADRPVGKSLSPAVRTELARFYLSIAPREQKPTMRMTGRPGLGIPIGAKQLTNEQIADNANRIFRCTSAGERLLSDGSGALVVDDDKTMSSLSSAVRTLVDWGSTLSLCQQPDLARAAFDHAIRLGTSLHGRSVVSRPAPKPGGPDTGIASKSINWTEGLEMQLAPAYRGRAELLGAKGRYHEAAVDYAQWLKWQKQVEARPGAGGGGFGFNQPPTTDFQASQRMAQAPYLIRYGVALIRSGEDDRAEAVFKEALSRYEAGQNLFGARDFARYKVSFDVGSAYLGAKKWDRAAEWFDRAATSLAANRPLGAVNPELLKKLEQEIAGLLRWSHQNRAVALVELKRYPEAWKALDAAAPFVPEAERWQFVITRACLVARSGDHATAVKTADELLARPDPSVAILYDAACVYSLASAAVTSDDELRTKYADLAVRTLKRSIDAGWKDAGHIGRDTDFDPVRARADFKQLVAELEKRFPVRRELAPPPRERP
jgi:tetratricopeptide (TPR) repeat protein